MPYWGWIILGAILALLLIPFGVGRFLPKRFAATTTIRLSQSPEAVWNVVTDYERFPVSATMRKRTEPLDPVDGLPCWREDIGSSRIRVTTLESRPPHRIVRQFADEVVPMVMRCQYDIEKSAGGSTLRCSADGTIENGTWHVPVFRFMIHVFGGIKSGQKQYLRSIARHFNETPQF